MKTVFVCAIQSPPHILPSGITAPVECGLPSQLAFVASHRAGIPYAMTIGRAPPAFPTAAVGGHVLQAKDVDLYLAWGGNVRCRVPIISAVNSAFGWIIVLDAPAAIGVKMPTLGGSALTPEPAPWNSWPATEKRGKEFGDQQPDPAWVAVFAASEVEAAVARVKEVMRELAEPISAHPSPTPQMPQQPPPIDHQLVASSNVESKPELLAAIDYDLPFDLPLENESQTSAQSSAEVAEPQQEPKAPQLSLF